MLKQGYKFKEFSWNKELTHEDLEIHNQRKTIKNPDGQWRSAQGDLPISANDEGQQKLYLRVRLCFGEGKKKFKYFGIAKRFKSNMLFKGNRMN